MMRKHALQVQVLLQWGQRIPRYELNNSALLCICLDLCLHLLAYLKAYL